MELTIDGDSSTRDLTYSQITWDTTQWTGADALSRDITGVEGLASGVVKEDPDRCSGDADNCLVGVVMSGWSGLDTGADKPARMPFADYTVEAVLMEGDDVAIAYPTISVSNTEASWDSKGGIFGTGSGTWGNTDQNSRWKDLSSMQPSESTSLVMSSIPLVTMAAIRSQ